MGDAAGAPAPVPLVLTTAAEAVSGILKPSKVVYCKFASSEPRAITGFFWARYAAFVDPSIALNVISLVVSAVALVTSVVVSRRQLHLTRDSNVLPVIVEMFRETRSPEFARSVEYLTKDFPGAYPAGGGYRDLPAEPKAHIRRVALFLDDVGKVVAHGIVSEGVVIGAYGVLIGNMWKLLGPYVYSEREKRWKNYTMIYFEDLAARARIRSSKDVYDGLGLLKCPPAD